MTKTEEALCNGITFSVPRMIPTAVQEGELENALYYVIAYLTPQLDKIVLKFYDAPSYTPLKWNDEEIECITFDMEKLVDADDESSIAGYNFGNYSNGNGTVYPAKEWIISNLDCMYNGLMLYSGLKCLIISTIKEIKNHK